MTKIDDLREAVNSHYKKELLVKGSDERLRVEYQSTGLLPIDVILGGGMPRCRYTMLVGAFSSLKSYVCLKTIATTHANGGTAAYIDTERTYDPEWAAALGVKTDELLVWPPPGGLDHDVTGEKAIDIACIMLRNNVDVLVFDSITAALPQDDVEKPMSKEKVRPGVLARMMSEGLRKLTASNSRTSVLMTSQTRESIGVTFGNPEVATGGRAPGFYASHILHMKPADKLRRPYKYHNGEKWVDGHEIYGRRMKCSLQKSKLSSPWRETTFVWDYGLNEIDIATYLFAAGVELGAISQKGSRWTYKDETTNGRENAVEALRANPTAMEELEAMVREHHKL